MSSASSLFVSMVKKSNISSRVKQSSHKKLYNPTRRKLLYKSRLQELNIRWRSYTLSTEWQQWINNIHQIIKSVFQRNSISVFETQKLHPPSCRACDTFPFTYSCCLSVSFWPLSPSRGCQLVVGLRARTSMGPSVFVYTHAHTHHRGTIRTAKSIFMTKEGRRVTRPEPGGGPILIFKSHVSSCRVHLG